MASKFHIIAAAAILICFWLMIGQSPNKRFLRFYSPPVEDLNQKFALTNFDNSLGKVGKKLWKSIEPAFNCPQDHLTRVGSKGGGKYVCGLTHLGACNEQAPSVPCIVYSFGVQLDSSFEAEVLTNTRCTVYAYDPTVSNIGIPLKSTNPRVQFFKMGVGGANSQNTSTLKTLMENNGGHDFIDILKMDVEGYEYASFDTIFQDFEQVPIGQLLVEIHYKRENVTEVVTEKIVQLFRNLEERGLRMFSKEVNVQDPQHCSEFSFINIRSLDKFLT